MKNLEILKDFIVIWSLIKNSDCITRNKFLWKGKIDILFKESKFALSCFIWFFLIVRKLDFCFNVVIHSLHFYFTDINSFCLSIKIYYFYIKQLHFDTQKNE